MNRLTHTRIDVHGCAGNAVTADLIPQDRVTRKMLVDVLAAMALNYLRQVKTTGATQTEERSVIHESTIESHLAVGPSRG